MRRTVGHCTQQRGHMAEMFFCLFLQQKTEQQTHSLICGTFLTTGTSEVRKIKSETVRFHIICVYFVTLFNVPKCYNSSSYYG